MKKRTSILFATAIVLLSGCVSLDNPEPQKEKPVVQKVTLTHKIKKVKPIVKKCKICSQRIKKKVIKNCAETVKTIVYRSSCLDSCGFPVSVRVPTTCKGSI